MQLEHRIHRDILICTLFVGVCLVFLRLPILVLPSTDDISGLYVANVLHRPQSWILSPTLSQNRLLLYPILKIFALLNIPDYIWAGLAYFPNAFLLPLLCALTIRTVWRGISLAPLLFLTGFSSLHPGILEAEHFWLIRVELTACYLIMVAFVMSWDSYPRWRALTTLLAVAGVGFSYQGYLNFLLAVLTLVTAAKIRDDECSIGKIMSDILRLAISVLSAMIILAVTLSIMKRFTSYTWGAYFTPLSPTQYPEKIVRVFGFYVRVLWGNTGFPNVPSGAVIVAAIAIVALFGVVNQFTWRKVIAIVFAIVGTTLAAMQLPSLPFSQQFYAMRSYPEIYLGFAGIAALALSGSSHSSWLRPMAATISAFIFLIAASLTGWASSSLILTRYHDFIYAAQFVGKLEDSKFKWDKPVVVGTGGYDTWKYLTWGATNSMFSLLAAPWSSHYLIGLVAARPIIPPTESQTKAADEFCKSVRSARPEATISDQGNYMALCL